MISVGTILQQVPQFVEDLLGDLAAVGVNVTQLDIDHVCFRVGTPEEYAHYRTEFGRVGRLLTEANVNGRPIATFKLHAPLVAGHRTIPLVELPAPKPGRAYATGLEHCEFVHPTPLLDLKTRHPHLTWDDGGMKKAHNPELALKLASGRVAKFHPTSLELVIEEELRIEAARKP